VNQAKPVPEWLLERYLLDELPRKERRRLEKELERNPALRAELEKLRVSDRQILSKYSPEQVIPEILKRAALDYGNRYFICLDIEGRTVGLEDQQV